MAQWICLIDELCDYNAAKAAPTKLLKTVGAALVAFKLGILTMAYDDLRKGRFSENGRAYFVTTVLANREARYFENFKCARLVVQNMKLLHEQKIVYSMAWVVMPDHVDWLFQLGETTKSLSEIVGVFKGRSAREINGYLGQNGTLWQRNFYDHALREEEDVQSIARYIVANPLRANLVKNIGDYSHWDAIWL